MKQLTNIAGYTAMLASLYVVGDKTYTPIMIPQFELGQSVQFKTSGTILNGVTEGFGVFPMYQQRLNLNGFPSEDQIVCCIRYRIRGEDKRSYNRYEIDLLPLNIILHPLTQDQIMEWYFSNDYSTTSRPIPTGLPETDTTEIPNEGISGHPESFGGLGTVSDSLPPPTAFYDFVDSLSGIEQLIDPDYDPSEVIDNPLADDPSTKSVLDFFENFEGLSRITQNYFLGFSPSDETALVSRRTALEFFVDKGWLNLEIRPAQFTIGMVYVYTLSDQFINNRALSNWRAQEYQKRFDP